MEIITENWYLKYALEFMIKKSPIRLGCPIIFLDITRPVIMNISLPGRHEEAVYFYITEKPLMLAQEKLFYNGVHYGAFLHLEMTLEEMNQNIRRTLIGGASSPRWFPTAALNANEVQVLRLLSDGRSTHMCAELLGIHPKYVSMYKCRAMNKLGIRRSTGLWRLMAVLKSVLKRQENHSDCVKWDWGLQLVGEPASRPGKMLIF